MAFTQGDNRRLLKNWGFITTNVEMKYIADFLIEMEVISPTDFDDWRRSYPVSKEQTEAFLLHLMKQTKASYDLFLDALQKSGKYEHIIKILEDPANTDSPQQVDHHQSHPYLSPRDLKRLRHDDVELWREQARGKKGNKIHLLRKDPQTRKENHLTPHEKFNNGNEDLATSNRQKEEKIQTLEQKVSKLERNVEKLKIKHKRLKSLRKQREQELKRKEEELEQKQQKVEKLREEKENFEKVKREQKDAFENLKREKEDELEKWKREKVDELEKWKREKEDEFEKWRRNKEDGLVKS